MFRKFVIFLVLTAFIFGSNPPLMAQDFSINQLPVPGTMVMGSAPFIPLSLKGLVIDLQKPLEFQFLLDTGNGPRNSPRIKEEASRLVKYFLAGLTIPEGDLWVNLSPYEKNRITTPSLGQTELGRDLLAEDYILKQLTASLIYPERDLGKEFWSSVYRQAQSKFGNTNIPVNTFNKVWILPDEAQVFENGSAVYVTKATLKVMLDEDYLALAHHLPTKVAGQSSIGSDLIRQIILPQIQKEVNTGKNFAALRQIYDALILAKWYKKTIQNGILDAVYENKNKIAGVNLNDPQVKEQIYERYLKAYKKGVFNYIKEEFSPLEGDGGKLLEVPRKYFSGGALMTIPKLGTNNSMSAIKGDGAMFAMKVVLKRLLLPKRETLAFQKGRRRFLKTTAAVLATGALVAAARIMQPDYHGGNGQIKLISGAYDPHKKDFLFINGAVGEGVNPNNVISGILSKHRAEFNVFMYTYDYENRLDELVREFQAEIRKIKKEYGINGQRRKMSVVLYSYGINIHREAVLSGSSDFDLFMGAPVVQFAPAPGGTLKAQRYFKSLHIVPNSFLYAGAKVFNRKKSNYYKVVNPYDQIEKSLYNPATNMKYLKSIGPMLTLLAEFDDEGLPGTKDPQALELYKRGIGELTDEEFRNLTFKPLHKTIQQSVHEDITNNPEAIEELYQFLRKHTSPEHSVQNAPENGGIDFNQINVKRTGRTMSINFDRSQLSELLQGHFDGFTPVITSLQYIQSPLPLLGLGHKLLQTSRPSQISNI